MLLDIEAESRKATTLGELDCVIANETRKLTKARQIFVFRSRWSGLRLTAISGLPEVNLDAPLVQDMQSVLRYLVKRHDLNKVQDLSLNHPSAIGQGFLHNYPFPHLLWLPFLTRGSRLLGGMLLAREQSWQPSDKLIAERLAGTYQHSLALLLSEPRLRKTANMPALKMAGLAFGALALIAAAMAIPIPLSTLAPMEISAHKPFVVSAPIEGIIEDILVNPGEEVSAGLPIIRLSDTVLRNGLEVAQREVQVAKARLKKANQMAFSDEGGRQELRMAMADLELKKAELSFAEDMSEHAVIKAQRAGVALYADKQGLIGKPVDLGERIMQIADPGQIEISIDVPIDDALILKRGARVRVFLDSDPLNAREAKIDFSDYQAHLTATGGMAFTAVASFMEDDAPPPRLGVRGTAQIYGDQAPLGFYLFRRPLSALRQWIGL